MGVPKALRRTTQLATFALLGGAIPAHAGWPVSNTSAHFCENQYGE
jgi:hypothetical protein